MCETKDLLSLDKWPAVIKALQGQPQTKLTRQEVLKPLCESKEIKVALRTASDAIKPPKVESNGWAKLKGDVHPSKLQTKSEEAVVMWWQKNKWWIALASPGMLHCVGLCVCDVC